MTNCGASSESCCTSLEVTGGTYYRTYANSGSGPTGEADPATISGFRLDKYAVTVGRFRQFANAWNGGAGYTPPAGSGKHMHLNGGQGLVNIGVPADAGTVYETGWVANDDINLAPTNANLQCWPSYDTWTTSPGGNENLPIDCVIWYEAYAFCIWDGGFLPSEAEWEYAAAGGSQQREYPWGTTDPGTNNQYAIYGGYYPSTSGMEIAPVGTATLGAGVWGQLDLTGDVMEWNLDWLALVAGVPVEYVDPCSDCAYLVVAPQRVTRGGNFDNCCNINTPQSDLLPPTRGWDCPTCRQNYMGFRCARTP